ncbi:MAG: head-tail joining protein [Geminicoccaceae bacterium]
MRRLRRSGSTPCTRRRAGIPSKCESSGRRPDTIVGFGETPIHAETATFELRASEVADPRQGDQLALDGETFLAQGQAGTARSRPARVDA